MRILSLRLRNFQGIRSLDMDFGGANAHIYGDNATGKTTALNALMWLLYDKPITDSKGFTPKTQGVDGETHNLSHEAEAAFQMDNGQRISLRKSYHEVYRKKRGSTAEEFDGHTTDYYVDDVPVKEKEYNEAVAAFGKPEQMRMLMLPEYFASVMKWQDRRTTLIEVCGDVSDADVIAAHEELAELPGILSGKSVDNYRKIAAAGKSKINKELDGMPGRIDEARRAMPDLSGRSLADISAEIKALEARKAEKEAAKSAVVSGDTLSAEMRKRIAELEARAAEFRAAFDKRIQQENAGTRQQMDALHNALLEKQQRRNELTVAHKNAVANVERMTVLRKSLHEQYAVIAAEEWDESQSVCPTCLQSLPREAVDEACAKFNASKSQRLEAINTRGRAEASAEMIDADKKIVDSLLETISSASEDIAALSAAMAELKSAQTHSPFESSPEYASHQKAMHEIEQCRAAMLAGTQDRQALAAPHDTEILNIMTQIRALEDEAGRIRLADAQKRRIAELEEQEAAMGAEYERLEHNLSLCENFVRAKVRMLDERINSRFETVRFRLFQEQINGGLSEDCEVLVRAPDGAMVPYRDANNAARINAGLEIIDTLGAAWGTTMPVCVDNAESVTQLRPASAQTIAMVVSEADKSLRLELDFERRMAV